MDDEESPKKPSKGNPFGGSDSDDDDDNDLDGDDNKGNPFGSGDSDDDDDDDLDDDSDDDLEGDDSDDDDFDGDDDDLDGGDSDDDLGDNNGLDNAGMSGLGDDMGTPRSAKSRVCAKCGHHEPDSNAKFCKMCGSNIMDKFMKKYMTDGVSCGGKKAIPWLDKTSDKGEIKKGGKETGKEMFKTVKGGKKDPGKSPEKTGGKVPAKTVKNENRICGTCGSLACEIHNAPMPTANRLNSAFFKSLAGQIGRRGGKYSDGVHDSVVEDALYAPPREEETVAPKPGEVGYAPTGRIGEIR
jgi:hypothetical protein